MKNFTLKFALLLLLGVSLAATAAAQKIGGIVKDSSGNPVIGATVIVEGTTFGASTGVGGDWSLNVPDASKHTLAISYIGMEPQKIAIGSRTYFDVELKDASTALDDVVVVGYAAVRRRDVVGSVSSVNSEVLTQMPVASVAEAMTGRMAGVSITTSEGDPDADIKIRVRGAGSLTQDSSPLYIVDGFPVESISDIPASEIQSIDVLKDAFSTAIYGSRGANGVVIVTTKSGKEGRVTVNYNVYMGFKDIARKSKLATMDVENFVKYQYEIAAIRDEVAKNYEPYFGLYSDIDLYSNIKGNDWMDQLFGRTGEQFNHNLSVSGGGDKFKWTAGYSRLYDKAIMTGSNYSRDNLNLKATYKANKKISFDFSIRYSDTKVRGAGANSLSDQGSSTTGRLRNAILYSPIPISGLTSEEDDPENSSDSVNPLDAVRDSDKKRRRTTWNANAGFTWEIVDNLRLKVEAGLENYDQVDNDFYGPTSYYSRDASSMKGMSSVRYTDTDRRRVRNTNTLAYDFKKVIGNKDHSLNILLGQEYMITELTTKQELIDGFDPELSANGAWNMLGAGGNVRYSRNTISPDDILFSFFGRVNYDFKSRYIFSATMRADGSSKFLKGNQWGYFPSAAVAWRLSEETWMKDASWIDNLKLRYSYGTAGNNNIPSGLTTQTFSANETPWLNNTGSYWTPGDVMANPDLTWETTYSHNIGIDFGFWKNRLSGSVEVYQNNTKDLLMNVPVQGSGYKTQYRNAGEIRNRGIEVSLGAVLVEKKNYGINFNANISFNQNRVMDLAQLSDVGYEANSGWNSAITTNDYIAVVGGALGDVRGYKTLGRYEVDDFDLDYYAATGKWVTLDGSDCSSVTGDMRPGSIKLLCDETGKPVYGVIGNVQPKFTGGFSLSGYAYGFDFAANFTYSYGNKVYNANRIEYTASHKYVHKGNIRNLLSEMSLGKRWTNVDWATGDLITDPAALAAANASTSMWSPYMPNTFMHSWALEDASYLRLSSLTVGYTLPQAWTRKIRIDRLRIYATGTNLFCWTPYTGADPEVDTRRSTPMTPNVDYSAYPKSRSWVFGINLSF
ncbi:TonB-dependent receptor [uncultured Alistipes sp.]|jgi:tonB-linked outer membrane protein, susC/ragA family|uniref:SusC/RagA family TonB-linked outer membrane protein n=1 Tax=uncultured Alistipes sp. TaxID=538949 RepID=UPI0025F7850B|nr:TonB-dependent receptor [uncultured Alistipes sp.]